MSKDLLLKHRCPHHVVEEWLSLENDRRTLLPLRNPSSKEIKILWNRRVVPPQGLYSKVEITSLVAEPYEIESGDNDELSFSVSGGSVQTIVLPEGRQVKAGTLVEAINESANGLEAQVSRGRITLQLHNAGPETTLKMEDGSAHGTLGLSPLRSYRGRTIVPAWNLVRDPKDVDPHARKIVFDEALRANDDIFEVSYYTRRSECRRCLGLGIENDLRHDRKGEPIWAEGQTLLLQEVDKIIFTIQGSHVFHRWYGTNIMDMIGSKIVGGGQQVEVQLVSEISNALSKYQQIKEEQSMYQPVVDSEMLQRVVSLDVSQDANDPTVFYVQIDLQSRAGKVESLEDTLLVTNADYSQDFQLR
jgi:phage baseplate assembly protein W